jgi:transaldolase
MRNLNIKIFADGADLKSILELNKNPVISGFTTNPTLMRKAGIQNYTEFAKEVLSEIKDKPISFEVFSDNLDEMKMQAKKISTWANNVYVKIPITNTKGESTTEIVRELSHDGVKLNVTAIFSTEQVIKTAYALKGGAPSVVSIFAGRIADTGRDPKPFMTNAVMICKGQDTNMEVLWASPRELFNIVEAEACNCDIITVAHDLLAKINLFDKDLEEFSLETVKMFYNDAQKAGYTL